MIIVDDIMDKFKDHMLVSEAAEYLGVSKITLQRWDNSGKLKSFRHPLNNFRLYKKSDLDRLLKSVKKNKGR